MADKFDFCDVWVVDYRLDGTPRRWIRALPRGVDVRAIILEELDELYAQRSALLELRQASDEERRIYLAGGQPFCPTDAVPPAPR